MPYIKTEDKEQILQGRDIVTPGELNWAITEFIKNYVKVNGLKYQTINDVIGALEGSKIEFYSRIARPYEDQKIKDNGDVY